MLMTMARGGEHMKNISVDGTTYQIIFISSENVCCFLLCILKIRHRHVIRDCGPSGQVESFLGDRYRHSTTLFFWFPRGNNARQHRQHRQHGHQSNKAQLVDEESTVCHMGLLIRIIAQCGFARCQGWSNRRPIRQQDDKFLQKPIDETSPSISLAHSSLSLFLPDSLRRLSPTAKNFYHARFSRHRYHHNQ